MKTRLIIACLLMLATTSAHADQPEAKEVARINNCPPKKIEVYKNTLGSAAKTIYQVTCNMPKTSDKDSKDAPDSLLISCDQTLCELMRPIVPEKK